MGRAKIPWGEVGESILRSNHLLADAPCPRLRRIARLARLPLDTSLSTKDVYIYVLVGPCLPYIGQTGYTYGPRALIKRYAEHLRKARMLRNIFLGTRHRRLRGHLGFGKTPGLSHTVARLGGHRITVVLVELVKNPRETGQREAFWERILSPNLSLVTPMHKVDRLRWEMALNTHAAPSESRSLGQRANEIIYKKTPLEELGGG